MAIYVIDLNLLSIKSKSRFDTVRGAGVEPLRRVKRSTSLAKRPYHKLDGDRLDTSISLYVRLALSQLSAHSGGRVSETTWFLFLQVPHSYGIDDGAVDRFSHPATLSLPWTENVFIDD